MQLTRKDVLNKFIINPDTKKCFIFDLDGTIIFGDKHISSENEKLLLMIKKAGHEILFASGRPLRDFRLLMPKWTHNCPMALFGGAMSLRDGVILRHASIAKDIGINVVEFCLRNNYPFVIDDDLYYYHPKSGHAFYDYMDKSMFCEFKRDNLAQILDNEIYKIFILDDILVEEFTEYVAAANLTIHQHNKFKSFDILPIGVNKYKGISPFIDYNPEDVFVFGDDSNDYELFANFHNTTLIGEHEELKKLAKLNIPQDNLQQINFTNLIHAILA